MTLYSTTNLGDSTASAESLKETAARGQKTQSTPRHSHILDTLEGDLTPFLLNLNGRSIPAWSAAAHETSSEKVCF